MDTATSTACVEKIKCATFVLQPFSFGQSWLPSLGQENATYECQQTFYKSFNSGIMKGVRNRSGFCLTRCRDGTLEITGLHRNIINPRIGMLHYSRTIGTIGGRIRPLFGLRIRPSTIGAAAWFKDKDAEVDASAEESEAANEELLLFFFQLDLTTRLQRALNLDQYEVAQQLREKLVEVDQEIARQKEAKLGSTSSKDELQDKAITILCLRNELQKAVEEEDYGGAAELRDKISQLEAESLAAAANALANQNVQYAFRLGQKIRHSKFGYRGVVCGMDRLCFESLTWTLAASVKNLSRGKNQPFYQVLVETSADPNVPVTYVAEENLMAPKEPDVDRFEHPYISFLFYGMDSAGDFIPIRQLREKYDKPRHELPWEKGDDDNLNGGGVKA